MEKFRIFLYKFKIAQEMTFPLKMYFSIKIAGNYSILLKKPQIEAFCSKQKT